MDILEQLKMNAAGKMPDRLLVRFKNGQKLLYSRFRKVHANNSNNHNEEESKWTGFNYAMDSYYLSSIPANLFYLSISGKQVMKQVELNKVSYHYSGHVALRPVSVGFGKDKITAIIGRSGSGKSTLLQLINGLLRPSQGNITIAGAALDYHRLPETRLKIGYAVQGNGLFPHLTVQENISITGRILKQHKSKIGNRVHELLTQVGLPDAYASRYPHELSGGEQQRVALCRALFLDPPLLLMDEPFGALDPVTRYEMQQEIIQIQKRAPRTILIVTHDMREARKLADDILVLASGELQQFDSKDNVLQSPANENVQHLIEASLQ